MSQSLRSIESDSSDSSSLIIGKFQNHENVKMLQTDAADIDDHLQKYDRKVLILHTGGTIGMFKSENGYKPQKDRFTDFLKNYPYFCDKQQTFFKSKDDFIITPKTVYGRRIWFKLKEMNQLIDSSNMNVSHWNDIISQLKEVYNQYDAFVVLHGTDTMAYTASMLSFAIENLKKTIVLTGAQIPISETRNDSINNLLCALIIAGHFTIPEVLIVFDNLLLRGNRAKKRSTSALTSFSCPNYSNLGTFGLTIKIHWKRIRPLPAAQSTTTFSRLTSCVANMKLTPAQLTMPTQKYIVMQSFGCGNMPTQGPLHQWLLKNSQLPEQQRQIILNVSQVENSMIADSYEAGTVAKKLGVVSGRDMTLEAAVGKLVYLASLDLGYHEVIKKIGENLRGELTEKTSEIGFLSILQRMFKDKNKEYQKILYRTVYPSIAVEKSNSEIAVEKLIAFGMDLKHQNQHQQTILHQVCQKPDFNDLVVLETLLNSCIDKDCVDSFGNTALYYSLQFNDDAISNKLFKSGAKLTVGEFEIFSIVKNNDVKMLNKLANCGYKFDACNILGQNLAMYAVVHGKKESEQFLREKSDLFVEEKIKSNKDRTGRTLNDYIAKYSNKQ